MEMLSLSTVGPTVLGETLGSVITGYLFKNVGADQAFCYTLIPVVLRVLALAALRRMRAQDAVALKTAVQHTLRQAASCDLS